MDSPIKSTGILVFKGNSVLLVKHGEKAGHINGVCGIPGGRFAENEGEKTTALRELKEETEPEWINISDLKNYNLLPNVEKAVLESKRQD